jgi:hypothetical protein
MDQQRQQREQESAGECWVDKLHGVADSLYWQYRAWE